VSGDYNIILCVCSIGYSNGWVSYKIYEEQKMVSFYSLIVTMIYSDVGHRGGLVYSTDSRASKIVVHTLS